MLIKFNPTGTHVQHGFLKVRLDIYPEPTDKTYLIHYVDEVDENGNPTGAKQLNPCLCHFISIDSDTTVDSLTQYVKTILDKATFMKLDDWLSKDRIKEISQVMQTRLGTGKILTQVIDIGAINTKFASFEIKI